MDAGDHLSAGPKALIVDPSVNGNPTATNPYGTNPDNPTMTAGSTFVGQFVDHDITFDQTSTLGVPQNPLTSPNTRTPRLDLDSVFGGGPGHRPDLYVKHPDGSVGPKLKLGAGGVHEDVPRVANGDGTYSALLGDPRNDESVIIGGLHCAHIMFYNRVLDELAEHDLRRFPSARRVDHANRHERFLARPRGDAVALPVAVGQRAPAADRRAGDGQPRPQARKPLLQAARRSRVHADRVRWRRLPVRAQHGPALLPRELHQRHRRQRRPHRRPVLRARLRPDEPDFSAAVAHDRADLLGGYPAPRRYIGWQTFFDLGDGQVKNNKKIDPTISSVLFTLPLPAIAPHTQTAPTVLPQRNLLRQLTWGMPSGQAIARAIGVPTLSRAELSDIGAIFAPFARHTPLWYYALAEAKALAGGLHLGPVGGRIVTETLIGLLRADPTSYLSAHPRFRPFLGTDLKLGPTPNPNITGDRSYTHAHFLHYARVVNPGTYR